MFQRQSLSSVEEVERKRRIEGDPRVSWVIGQVGEEQFWRGGIARPVLGM